MPKTDWIKIKNEYINTSISQRKLAEKYGISVSTLTKRANKEKWQQEKETQCNKIETKVQQKTADKIVKSEVDRIANILALGDKLSAKIDKAIGQLETAIVDGEEVDTGIVDVRGLRSLVQSVKDLKDIVRTDDNGDEIRKLDTILNGVDEIMDHE